MVRQTDSPVNRSVIHFNEATQAKQPTNGLFTVVFAIENTISVLFKKQFVASVTVAGCPCKIRKLEIVLISVETVWDVSPTD